MGCENCSDHSGHEAVLEEHGRRLNAHDQEFNDVKKSKVSKFLLIILLGILTSVFGIQATVLYDVSTKVTTLYALNSKDNDSKPMPEKTTWTGPELWISKR